MLERDVEKYLKKEVEKRQGLCLKFTSPGTRGVPDRIVLHNGKVHFVEVKKPGGNLRVDQILMKDLFYSHGHPVTVVSSKIQVDDFIRQFLVGG